MKLITLEIAKFRNVENINITANDTNIITGANGIGKTTIIDSIMWLLCDETLTNGKSNEKNKDVNNHKKPLGIKGTFAKEDGTELVLERKYYESWKEDEDGELKFNAIKNNFYINGATYTGKDYWERIRNEIGIKNDCKTKTFNLLRALIDYSYLDNIDYKIARKFIEEILALPTDDELLKNEDFEIIKSELKSQNYDIAKTNSIFKNSKDKANTKIEELETRLDIKKNELNLSELEKLEQYNQEKSDLINSKVEDEEDYKSKNSEIESLEIDLKALSDNFNCEIYKQELVIEDLIEKGQCINFELANNDTARSNLDRNIENEKLVISQSETTIKNNETLIATYDDLATCPNCNHDLGFDEKTNNEIVRLKNDNARLTELIKVTKTSIKNFEKDVKVKSKHHDSLVDDREKLKVEYLAEKEKLDNLPKVADNEDYKNLLKQLEETKTKLNNIQQKFNNTKQEELLNIQTKITELNSMKNIKVEIDNLSKEIKDLKSIKAKSDLQMNILKEFKQMKIKLTKDNTAKVFPNIEFEMLSVSDTTGVVSECCHATYKGVEFNSVNSGNRYPLGIEVIENIKSALGVTEDLPVIFDKSADLDQENFNRCRELTNAQIFTTKVSSNKIMIENEENINE